MTANTSQHVAVTRSPAVSAASLPAWPLFALFVCYPVWWILGLGEFAWTIAGIVMAVYLLQHGPRRVPKGFGIVLAFLLWIGLSVIAIDTFSRLLGFGFRYSQYIATAVAFVYVYNARKSLHVDRVLGYLTVFWGWVVAGGYLGLLFPVAVIQTPLYYVLPKFLLANDLVQQMAVRRLTQFNPDGWSYIDPRPSAPFLYTNNWGNAFSLLLPLVILYIARLPHGWRRVVLIVALPISMVPAFLTLNRGMFIGLGVVATVVAVQLALQGQWKALVGLISVGAVGAILATALPIYSRLENRLENSGTNDSRLAVYMETITRTATSPFFGFGAPRPAENTLSILPPAGTQGQLWMVMFSHGFIGAALFLAVLLWMVFGAMRWKGLAGIVTTGIIVATVVEVFYYGVLGAGLYIVFIAAALAMREASSPVGELSYAAEHGVLSPARRNRSPLT